MFINFHPCSLIFHWLTFSSSSSCTADTDYFAPTSASHNVKVTWRCRWDLGKFDRQWTFIFGNLWNNFDVISSETHLKRRVSIAEAIVSTSHLETSAALNFAKRKTLSPSAREKGQSRFNATPCNDSAFTWLTSTPCLAQRAVCT